jgi:hypothetical protein
MWKKITTEEPDTSVPFGFGPYGDEEPDGPWHANHAEVTSYGRHLVDAHQWEADGLQHFYEKPWKWTQERNSWAKNDKLTYKFDDVVHGTHHWDPRYEHIPCNCLGEDEG